MKTRAIVNRLRAHAAGRPLPSGETIRLQIAEPEDRLLLSFVRMGGESLPWGVGIQVGEEPATLLSVPDARKRDPVGDMNVKLAAVLTEHLGSALLTGEDVDPDKPPSLPLRQVWVPNGAHLSMLHLLNLRYTRAQYGDPERALALRALGRTCGFLFRESERAGQATIINTSSALSDHFVFPADDIRQQHLGFVLALLDADGDIDERLVKAEEAEKLSVSTSLSPDLERSELEPLVSAYNKAERDGNNAKAKQRTGEIKSILDEENSRRLKLMASAIEILRSDEREINSGAADLAASSIKERDSRYRWGENNGAVNGDVDPKSVTPPETDNYRPSASKRYYRMIADDDFASMSVLHSDAELQEVAIVEGDALRGVVRAVERRKSRISGTPVPVWTVESGSENPSRLREGSKLCVVGVPDEQCVVIAVTIEDGLRRVELEAHSSLAAVAEQGEEIVLLPSSAHGITRWKSKLANDDTGVGSWLTHGTGSRPAYTQFDGEDVLKRVNEMRGE